LSHGLKTRIRLPTPQYKLSSEPITSPPKKKSITTFKLKVVDLQEDEEWSYLDKMGGGGGQELQAIAMQGNLE
jgi:hypothetical protein